MEMNRNEFNKALIGVNGTAINTLMTYGTVVTDKVDGSNGETQTQLNDNTMMSDTQLIFNDNNVMMFTHAYFKNRVKISQTIKQCV